MKIVEFIVASSVAGISYLILPDILDRQETLAFLIIVGWSIYMIIRIIEDELHAMFVKRESLRIRKPGKALTIYSLPKKIIHFPIEERYEKEKGVK